MTNMNDMTTTGFRGSEKAYAVLQDVLNFINTDIRPLEVEMGLQWGGEIEPDFLRKIWKMSADAGFYTLLLPEKLGGAGLNTSEVCAVKEGVMASGSVLAAHVLGELSGPPRIGHLFKHASELQIENFLQPICKAEKSVCFALTETDAGSDAAAIQTRAVKDGDHYVLNGQKRFISGGSWADLAIVMAVTDPEKGPAGISAFFVDLASEGCRLETDYAVLSGAGSHADIYMDDVRVPAENLIGQEGSGFRLGMSRIMVNRLLHCSTMVGLAQYALTETMARATGRRQFGRAIAEFQAIQHMLADMNTSLYAARCMMYDAATQLDAGKDIRMESSMCKVFVAESTFKIADTAMQVQGGVGLLKGSAVEAIFRQLRTYRIVTGTSEIQRNTIAKQMLKGAKE